MRKFELKTKSKSILLKIASLSVVVLILVFGFSQLPKVIDKVVNKTTKISEYNLTAQNLLGLNSKKNILILFMNNAEQRYGGGFIGSVGYVTADKGKLKPDPVRNVYYYDYDFGKANYVEKSSDPNEGEVVHSLKDSGQSLDWPLNAKRAKTIFERESGKNVDIVVAVTPEILKYLIRQTGPVVLDDYKLTVTDSNITETIQQQVESGWDKRKGKDPKTILTSLMGVLIDRLAKKSVVELIYLGSGLNELIDSRQILVYSNNYDFAKLLEKYRIDGSLRSITSDYFLMSEKNVSIDKSNAYIDRSLSRTVNINQDGTIDITATITRNQTIPESFPYIDPHAPDVLTYLIRKNKSYIKVALPSKTQILDLPGGTNLEYRGKESGYDVYGFQSDLEPLTPTEYKFKYRLPFKLAGESSFHFDSYLQYANGGWPYKLQNTVVAPNSFVFDSSNKNVKIDSNKVVYKEDVNKDVLMNFVFSKK